MDPTQIEKDIEEYIQSRSQKKDPISLARFVVDKHQYIVNNTTILECRDVQGTWSRKFGNVAKRLKIRVTESRKNVDWASLSAAILKRVAEQSVLGNGSGNSTSPPSRSPTKTSISSSTSRSAASKSDSFQLTPEARLQYEERFHSLETGKKWFLSTGRSVEDVMFKIGSESANEHAVHSFILNIDDPVWKKELTEEEFDEVRTYRGLTLPDIDEEASALFTAVETKADEIVDGSNDDDDQKDEKLLNALSDLVIEAGPYDYRTKYDLYWVQSALTQILTYYKFDVIRGILQNSSEMDFVTTFWSILDRCFHNIRVVPGRDRTCQATSCRVNKDRDITGNDKIDAKKTASRPDLLLIKSGVEFGCSEVSRSMDIVPTKKEVVETRLHNPKTMKDLFDRIIKEGNNDLQLTRQLQIVSFNNTGRRMKLAVMDCPGGYVCRVQETDEYEIPMTIQQLTSQVVPILILTLQAKTIVKNMTSLLSSCKAKPKGRPQFKASRTAVSKQDENQITLPPALSTFAPTTTARKRKNDEVD